MAAPDRIQVAKYMIDNTMLWREDVRPLFPRPARPRFPLAARTRRQRGSRPRRDGRPRAADTLCVGEQEVQRYIRENPWLLPDEVGRIWRHWHRATQPEAPPPAALSLGADEWASGVPEQWAAANTQLWAAATSGGAAAPAPALSGVLSHIAAASATPTERAAETP